MIGVFDSGLGGLTIIKELKQQLPGLSFIYLGDNARTPYGNRSREIIQKYSLEDANFLISQGATVIVVACNTASAFAGQWLKEQLKAPVFEVITPAAQEVAEKKFQYVGVMGTRGTINSNAYQQAILGLNKNIKISTQSCPLFVPLVEEGWLKHPEAKMIARRYLTPLKRENLDALILGCTHYPLMKDIIQEKIGRKVKLIDPAYLTVKALAEYLKGHNHANFSGQEKYFATDPTELFKNVAAKWLGQGVNVEKAEV